MIRTTITKTEFEKLTWLTFENVASNINDILVELVDSVTVKISVLGEELTRMSVSDYNEVIKPVSKPEIKTFRNSNFTKRNYECTNVVFCQAPEAPGAQWIECSPEDIEEKKCAKLYRQGDAIFYGWL